MRRMVFLAAAVLAVVAIPLQAVEQHQSYITFDDGGTVVLQSDGQSIDGRVNLPVYPGDEVRTPRSGRVEIRLSDGNVIALDQTTAVQFQSILESYEGEDAQTVASLQQGRVMVQRISDEGAALRLDTSSASYVSSRDAVYSVEARDTERDVVTVYAGSIEIRTRNRTGRLREGDSARVDEDGIYAIDSYASDSLDEFERWYLKRSDRSGTSRYLDARLSYADSSFDDYGSWVYVGDYGSWVWRPTVTAGWRPYYYGSWSRSPRGTLVWVSSEPWGFVPYHYGRWAFTPLYGWVWLPGQSYAPAWVYWAFGPTYVGWSPMGFYDCYNPYYDWAYRPYRNAGLGFGLGFYGQIRLSRTDLSPWTFVGSNGLTTGRIDRAALTTDAIRERLNRDGDRVTVTNNPLRFTRDELRNPVSAIVDRSRRGIGGGTGKDGSGSTTDLTPFFRRDPELSTEVRQRVIRRDPSAGPAQSGTAGGVENGRINRGGVTPSNGIVDRGTTTPEPGNRIGRPTPPSPGNDAVDRSRPGSDGAIRRSVPGGESPSVRHDRTPAPGDSGQPGHVSRDPNRDAVKPAPETPAPQGRTPRRDWRSGVERSTPAPAPRQHDDSWRRPVVERPPVQTPAPAESTTPKDNSRGSIPRRVIDGIGGVRVTPRVHEEAPRPSAGSGESVKRPAPVRTEKPAEKSAPKSPPRQNDEGHVKRQQH
ncbi:MAG: DUF6600 domain-containing protein [Acidobacteriota bacterium]